MTASRPLRSADETPEKLILASSQPSCISRNFHLDLQVCPKESDDEQMNRCKRYLPKVVVGGEGNINKNPYLPNFLVLQQCLSRVHFKYFSTVICSRQHEILIAEHICPRGRHHLSDCQSDCCTSRGCSTHHSYHPLRNDTGLHWSPQ